MKKEEFQEKNFFQRLERKEMRDGGTETKTFEGNCKFGKRWDSEDL